MLVQGERITPLRRPPHCDEPGEAVGRAFAAVTADDARGWFGPCGYIVH
jgi:hypothetical protein